MADRGRDLKFSILSDISQFDTDKPAKGLEDLEGAAKAAGTTVDRIGGIARDAGRNLADLGDRAGRALTGLERGARDTATKVDSAFDKIARSSRTNLRQKLDDDLDEAGKGLDDFKEEAGQSGREAAASFGGGFDDIGDFIQETAANAFGGFGPLGAAAGIAAAAGIGIITKVFGDSKESAEEAKAAIGDWVQAFVDGQGKIQETTIAGKLNSDKIFGDPERFKELSTQAALAGVSLATYGRALAGSVPDQKKLSEQLAISSQRVAEAVPSNGQMTSSLIAQRAAIGNVAHELGITTGQMGQGKKAWEALDEATRAGITANVEVDAPTPRELRNEHASMQRELGRQVNVPVKVNATAAARIAWMDADRYFQQHPITIRTKAGARPIRDVP